MTSSSRKVNRSPALTAETGMGMEKRPSLNQSHTHTCPQPPIKLHMHRHHQQHSLGLSIHVCVLRNEQLQSRWMIIISCLVNRSLSITAETRMSERPSLNQSHSQSRSQPRIKLQMHRHYQQHSLVSNNIHVCVLRDEQLQSRWMIIISCLVNRSLAKPEKHA